MLSVWNILRVCAIKRVEEAKMDGSGAPAPRRRPTEGGYARGEETRERIIEAAFAVFAEEGYAGASTRRIAAEAGVNPPALQYYFDSKEGLHLACALAAVDRVMQDLGPAIEMARNALAGGSRTAAVEAICGLVEAIAGLAMTDRETQAWSRFIGQCQTDTAGPAYSMMEVDFLAPLRTLSAELTAQALDLPPGDPIAPLHALLLFSIGPALQTKRTSLLAAMGWRDFDGDRATLVKTILRQQVTRICQGD
jgi:AcrR family transcriptional regulator